MIKNVAHLVLIWPESTDCQFHLVPLSSMRARDIPHGNAKRPTINPHINPQCPRAVAVSAVQEVAELHAVRVVFT